MTVEYNLFDPERRRQRRGHPAGAASDVPGFGSAARSLLRRPARGHPRGRAPTPQPSRRHRSAPSRTTRARRISCSSVNPTRRCTRRSASCLPRSFDPRGSARWSPSSTRPAASSSRRSPRRNRRTSSGELARPLPEIVVGHLTGVPEEDRHLLHEYSDQVVASIQHHDPDVQQASRQKVAAFDAHLLDVIRARRTATDRPDDAMTAMVEYRDEAGRPLPDEKILLHLSKDLITGGIDTTTHMVGNLFHDLLTTPGAYERVRDERSLVPHAVEESLRHRPGGERAVPPASRRHRDRRGAYPGRLDRRARLRRRKS